MAHLPLPDGAGIRALFAFRPEPAGPMADLANILLHAPNSLTPGERELIAAYVSSLNDCTYCLDSHAAIASWHFGNDEGFVRSVVADPASRRERARLVAEHGYSVSLPQPPTA